MLSSFKILAGIAALLVAGASAHDGVTQLYEAVSPASYLDGEPAGKVVKIAGVDTYVALPSKAKSKKGSKTAVLYLSDIYGLPLVNNKLLADRFAEQGYPTFLIDYFNGDPVPVNATGFNTTEWFTRHGEDQTTPPLLAVVDELKKWGVKKFAATGYCFGGLYAIRLAQNNTVAVSVTAHPSRLSVPADFLLLQEQGTTPLEIHSASLDTGFTPALAAIADGVMNGTAPETAEQGPYEAGYVRYEHVGVAMVRTTCRRTDQDLTLTCLHPAQSDPLQLAELDAAFEATVQTISKYL
ncbi:alpha/beta-hydrolase [Auriculariales sp. MPI-PUGE-AT-0066]|nr:alpha/beta-hydrolase [Auriculariales sp. MPI-PUGE-AT-0066]